MDSETGIGWLKRVWSGLSHNYMEGYVVHAQCVKDEEITGHIVAYC